MGRIKELTMFNAIEEFLITYHGNEEVIEDIGVELNNGEVKLIEKEDILEVNNSYIKYKLDIKISETRRIYIIPFDSVTYMWINTRSAEINK